MLAAAALALVLVAAGSAHGSASSAAVSCPLRPTSAIPRGEVWAFTVSGAPVGSHAGYASTYAHGRGTWTDGRGGGTICRQDAGGQGPRDLVLRVRGSARVSPGITRLGQRGVGLVLSVAVAASDGPGCPVGTGGTVTMFASYYQMHHDSLRFAFAGGCTSYNAAYSGPKLLALVAREGRQVN
jgi:hypothetical protein